MLISKLADFYSEQSFATLGAMGAALIVTRKAKSLVFPLDPDGLLTQTGGQVAGLSGSAINKILAEHGISQKVGTESGRTSRGNASGGSRLRLVFESARR